MNSSIVIKLGSLVIDLSFEKDVLDHFLHLLGDYVVNEHPTAKIKFSTDASLINPDVDDLYFLKHMNPVFSGKSFKIKTAFCIGGFDYSKKEGFAFFPDAQFISRLGVFMFLQVTFGILLLDYDTFLVHAAGLEYDNKGYLFPGKSGTGKTTLASKAKTGGIFVLADDCVGLDVKNKVLFSTFFKQSHDFLTVPFERCFFIKHGLRLSKTPISKQEATYRLIQSLPLVFFLKERATPFMGKIIKLANIITSKVPSFELESRLDDEIKVIFDELETN